MKFNKKETYKYISGFWKNNNLKFVFTDIIKTIYTKFKLKLYDLPFFKLLINMFTYRIRCALNENQKRRQQRENHHNRSHIVQVLRMAEEELIFGSASVPMRDGFYIPPALSRRKRVCVCVVGALPGVPTHGKRGALSCIGG